MDTTPSRKGEEEPRHGKAIVLTWYLTNRSINQMLRVPEIKKNHVNLRKELSNK